MFGLENFGDLTVAGSAVTAVGFLIQWFIKHLETLERARARERGEYLALLKWVLGGRVDDDKKS